MSLFQAMSLFGFLSFNVSYFCVLGWLDHEADYEADYQEMKSWKPVVLLKCLAIASAIIMLISFVEGMWR